MVHDSVRFCSILFDSVRFGWDDDPHWSSWGLGALGPWGTSQASGNVYTHSAVACPLSPQRGASKPLWSRRPGMPGMVVINPLPGICPKDPEGDYTIWTMFWHVLTMAHSKILPLWTCTYWLVNHWKRWTLTPLIWDARLRGGWGQYKPPNTCEQ